MNARSGRHLPVITPETSHFWDGTRRGELLLQRCEACETTYFPPQPFCPSCQSGAVRTVRASGRGRLHSYVISHLPAPGLAPPFVIAVVALEEGPRMMTNIVGCDPVPEQLALDAPVEVVFEPQSDTITLPLFRPVEA